jgi:hypothetical protein
MLDYIDNYTQVMMFSERSWSKVVLSPKKKPNVFLDEGGPAPLSSAIDETVRIYVRACVQQPSLTPIRFRKHQTTGS